MVNKKNTWVKKAPKPAIGWLCSIQIQKEVISNQKQPSCKKGAAPKKAMVKKDVKSKVASNSPQLSLLKFLPLTYHHSHFLAATLDFTSFFTMAFLGAAPFFTAWLFLIRYIYIHAVLYKQNNSIHVHYLVCLHISNYHAI